MADSAGERLAHYRVIGPIGRGGMGIVLRGEDELLQRPVALKFLPDVGEGSREQRARFMREARTAASINHPNVCTIYQVGEVEEGTAVRLVDDGPPLEPGTPYIVMELVEGRTLTDILGAGPMPLNDLLDLALQIAEGVEEAHARGIVHRDLKSGNVMLTEHGRIKILDFGLARITAAIDLDDETGEAPTVTELTREGTILGTIAYMSPEQIQGQKVDARTDLFSLGILFHEMATGVRPFQGETGASTMAKILEAEAPPLRDRRPELPEAFERAVSRCLRKVAADRGDTATLVRDLRELRRVVSGVTGPLPAAVGFPGPEVLVSPPAEPTRILSARRPRVPRAAAAAFAAVVVTLAALAGWTFLAPGGLALPTSVAVLPMTNLDEDAFDSQYVSDGVAQSVADRLNLTELYVTPWVSSRRYGRTDRPASQIASELNVDSLLTGTFRTLEEQDVEMELTLFDARRGRPFDTRRFVSSDGRLLALNSEVAAWVADRLQVGIDSDLRGRFEKPETESDDAWGFYLQGVQSLQEGGREATATAEKFFARAIEMDPEFVNAHVGAGAVQSDYYFFGWKGVEALGAAENDYEVALRLDPASMSARRGLIRVEWENGRTEASLHQGKEAQRVGRDTDVEALVARAEAYNLGGLADKALPLLRRAIELDPVNVGAHWFEVIALAWSMRYDEALVAGNRFLELLEDEIPASISAEVHCWVAFSHHATGQLELARDHYEQSIRMFGDGPNDYVEILAGHLLRQMGNETGARATWRRAADRQRQMLVDSPTNVRLRISLAAVLVLLGEEEARQVEADLRADLTRVGHPLTYYLAMAHLVQDHPADAVRWLQAVVDNGGVTVLWKALYEVVLENRHEEFPEVVAVLEQHVREETRRRRLY